MKYTDPFPRVEFGGPSKPRTRRAWPWLLAVAAIAILAALLTPAGAHAGETAAPVWGTCPNLKNWQPNEDEQDRRPTPSADGLVFEHDQLVHHPVAMDLKDVHPGAFVADPAPSLADFFSIEVYSTADPHGYATLRWNPTLQEWNLGGTDKYGFDPVKLATDNNRSTNVVSFGVGYVAHPADGTKTTVSSVTFHGVTYDLTCKPAPASSSASPKPSKTNSSPKPSASKTSHSPVAGGVTGGGSTGSGALAITGPNGWVLGGIGVALFAVGIGGIFVAQRRRKTRFVA